MKVAAAAACHSTDRGMRSQMTRSAERKLLRYRSSALIAVASWGLTLAACGGGRPQPVTPPPAPPPPPPPVVLSQGYVVSLVPTVPIPVRVGTQVSLRLESNTTGYAHLYLIDPGGQVWVLGENMVLTGSLDYPRPGSGVTLTAGQPVGFNDLTLLVTRQPIAGFSGYETLESPVSLADDRSTFRARLSRVTSGLPRDSWARDEIQVRVTG